MESNEAHLLRLKNEQLAKELAEATLSLGLKEREISVEAALEEVRARAMAMQKCDEILDIVSVLFKQLPVLGILFDQLLACGVVLFEEYSAIGEQWMAGPNGEIMQPPFKIPYDEDTVYKEVYGGWKNKESFRVINLEGEALGQHMANLERYTGLSLPAGASQKQINGAYFHLLYFPGGCLFITTNGPLPGYHDIFKRLAQVFRMAYTRFLDLQKAEAQDREATIVAALEKVREKAISMYSTADLASTVSMVFTELDKLGVSPVRCGVYLVNKDTRRATLYSVTTSAEGKNLELMGWAILANDPILENVYKNWLTGEDYFPLLHPESFGEYYKNFHYEHRPNANHGTSQVGTLYGNFLPFPEGGLFNWAEKPLAEADLKILKRFTKIIGLTFRRYIELKKSEDSTRDAIRQSSLNRVRAEIASMRSTLDLELIIPLIWSELKTLGVPFIRCGVFIVNEEEEQIHSYLSTPEGKAIAGFKLPFNSEGVSQTVFTNWQNQQFVAVHWDEEDFERLATVLVEQHAVESEEKYLAAFPANSLDLHFFPFLQGMLYVGNIGPLTDDEKDLVQSIAGAFATAYARYEDFTKLEAAKRQVEHTLSALKAAQAKLIQAEKMASLGELTAGIAHEIQNPLNFVNNFSNINREMIGELKEELAAGNLEEVLAIANDLEQNEGKINQHGKRADFIVKGMLQHSRAAGEGEPKPTNINLLVDEFLKASYNSLQGKNKGFTAKLLTSFGEALPQIKVVQQGIGKALLNIFNNAFYAVEQRQKKEGEGYVPEVSASTWMEDGLIIIKVRDNGTGIPGAIQDKIMQPFFTTKPTGEFTGLGLSLTYDIVVKAHGGKIDVTSKEGEYTEFIISLPA